MQSAEQIGDHQVPTSGGGFTGVRSAYILFGLCQSCHDEKLDMNQV